MIKAVVGIILGVISIFFPQYIMRINFDNLVFAFFISLPCAIAGLIYCINGILELKKIKRILTIFTILIYSTSLISNMYVFQIWALSGGLIDF
jgi:hypothetical protein